MPICNSVQCRKAILLWLTLGLPMYAQSQLGLTCTLHLDARVGASHSLGPGCRDSAADADAVSQRKSGEALQFPQSVGADRPNREFTDDTSELCEHMAQYDALCASQPRISGFSTFQSGIADVGNTTSDDAKPSSASVVRPHDRTDFDHDVYYRNKLEFAFDGGWLPVNIPFVFDIFLGDAYNMTPLRYTLVPLVASLRWHIDDVGGPWILRGNWDMTFSGSITLIPSGPETRYFSYDMGIRRNFVPRRGKVAPYFDGQLGLGEINAKEPLGVLFAQGQNFTFTMNLGSGVRYNFNPRYSLSAGLHWMHISNLYLSEPAFSNYGINVYGPMFGIDVRFSKPRRASQ